MIKKIRENLFSIFIWLMGLVVITTYLPISTVYIYIYRNYLRYSWMVKYKKERKKFLVTYLDSNPSFENRVLPLFKNNAIIVNSSDSKSISYKKSIEYLIRKTWTRHNAKFTVIYLPPFGKNVQVLDFNPLALQIAKLNKSTFHIEDRDSLRFENFEDEEESFNLKIKELEQLIETVA